LKPPSSGPVPRLLFFGDGPFYHVPRGLPLVATPGWARLRSPYGLPPTRPASSTTVPNDPSAGLAATGISLLRLGARFTRI